MMVFKTAGNIQLGCIDKSNEVINPSVSPDNLCKVLTSPGGFLTSLPADVTKAVTSTCGFRHSNTCDVLMQHMLTKGKV